jgi:hypothetical protein
MICSCYDSILSPTAMESSSTWRLETMAVTQKEYNKLMSGFFNSKSSFNQAKQHDQKVKDVTRHPIRSLTRAKLWVPLSKTMRP